MDSLPLGSQLRSSERTLRVPEKPVISNTSPLVGLWTLNLFPLLRELYTEVLIPEEVRGEFFAIETEVREAALKSAPWIRTVRLRNPENIATHAEVDLGEAAVFVLAQERDARLVILDDRDARQYAERIGLPFTGTVGLLLEAKESGFIDAVAPLLDVLLENGGHLSPSLIRDALQQAGETS
ncbi:DUF3368 domain-containing protein [Candidatus Poribacteria bacterium]|nr:DUF3368 domain-containing protein [Candidatus Poribacteria bacterium]MYK17825.1 DUF3368 domain-containing protein [Candidatus Poribacteria bacterium]